MLGRREGGDALGVAQQHMQEFVTDNRLDVLIGTAVFLQERQIHEQARTRLAGDRQCRDGLGEFHLQHFQYRTHRERILFDEFLVERMKIFCVHA